MNRRSTGSCDLDSHAPVASDATLKTMTVPGPRSGSAARSSGAAAQVRPGWLLGALALLVLAALCCAYLSLCLLFVQGQWQLLYHPQEHTGPPATPASRGLAYTAVRFGPDEAGVSELSGWWLPAPGGATLPFTTVLYLHDGAGTLSDTVPDLARIHALGCAVLAIDYRGYGESAAGHPSEAKMLEDTRRAINYLVDTRHLAPTSLVLWGRGFGATLAAETPILATPYPLVLEESPPPALVLLGNDPRTRMLPLRLLLRDRLDAAPALAHSRAPKLFLAPLPRGSSNDLNTVPDATRRLYTLAQEPKRLASDQDDGAVLRFLSQAALPTANKAATVTSLIP